MLQRITMRSFGVWRSLVAQLVWDQWVGSSNLSTPTIFYLQPATAVGR